MRFLIAIISFLGYAVQYIQRIDMSVAIVCMVNYTGLDLQKETANKLAEAENDKRQSPLNESIVDNCYFKEQAAGSKLDGPFLWDKSNYSLLK